MVFINQQKKYGKRIPEMVIKNMLVDINLLRENKLILLI